MPVNRGYTCDRCGYQDPGNPELQTVQFHAPNFVYCFDCAKDIVEVLKEFNKTDVINKD